MSSAPASSAASMRSSSVARVGGHGLVPRLLAGSPQGRVPFQVPPAAARRDLDLLDELREELPPRLVGGALLVLDRMPLGMSAHTCSFGAVASSGFAPTVGKAAVIAFPR